jgi:histone deacetylase 11
MLLATEGTVLSALVAVEKGWAINLGGGYHHANIYAGSGFCIYPDITICVHYLKTRLNIKRILIVDLDAHQGNGHERDLIQDSDVFILDAYNPNIFPGDSEAAKAIK